MLIYHPAYDINHSLFRALLILESSALDEFHLDLFRIIDFYTVFPHFIKRIKPFPIELKEYRKSVNDIPSPYERTINVKRVMYEIESIQTTALHNLLAKGFLDIDAFNRKLIKRSKTPLPELLAEEISNCATKKEIWFKMLVEKFGTIKFKGKAGLKSRSGLMEFRYDTESI